MQFAFALPCCDSDENETCSTGYTARYNYVCDNSCSGQSAVFLGCSCNSSTQHISDKYTVNNATSLAIIERCVCKTVTNNLASGRNLMIPAKTATEWSSFYNNLPTGVTTTGTCPP